MIIFIMIMIMIVITKVIVCKWPPPLRNTYYRNLMPDMAVTKCTTCNKVQKSFYVLQKIM